MKKTLYLLIFLLTLVIGCGGKIPHSLVRDYQERGPRLIAVLPVTNNTADVRAAQILRQRILDALYFKGYPKIPLDVVDSKLKQAYHDLDARGGVIPPQAAGELTGTDAVMYCILENMKTSYIPFYARTVVSVAFELRSAKTGEALWSARYHDVRHNFDVTRKWLEMKTFQIYDTTLQEVTDKAMETLPGGPDTVK